MGVFGEPGVSAQYAFEDMLQMDVIRGPHSTGVVAVSDKNVYLNKGLMLPSDMIQNPKYVANVDKKWIEIFCYMGHNRWATEGAVTRRNAHPFQHGHITLMHNGTLHWKMDTGDNKFDTDSEGICWFIKEHGIDEAWKELSGAAALTWWDARDKTLNIVTNGQRPMNLALSKKGDHMMWASEPWMFRAAADRRNIELGPNVAVPADHQLFTFTYDEVAERVEWTTRKLEPYSNVWKGTGFGANRGWDWDDDYNNPQMWSDLFKKEDKEAKRATAKAANAALGMRYNPVTNAYEAFDKEEAYGATELKLLGKPDIPDELAEIDALKDYKKAGLSDKEFEEKYDSCASCGDTLEGQLVDSVIIDEKYAVCEACVLLCEQQHLRIHDLVQNGK